jgi:hypothetical protein
MIQWNIGLLSTWRDAHDVMGAFARVAQQPGCAPGLLLAMFASVAHERAWPPRAKRQPSAWLSGNDQNLRFLGAWLRAAQVGNFRWLSCDGGVASAGSRGKVKLPRARATTQEGQTTGESFHLYKGCRSPCLSFFLLLLIALPPPS